MEGLAMESDNRLRLQGCLLVLESKELRVKNLDEVYKSRYPVHTYR